MFLRCTFMHENFIQYFTWAMHWRRDVSFVFCLRVRVLQILDALDFEALLKEHLWDIHCSFCPTKLGILLTTQTMGQWKLKRRNTCKMHMYKMYNVRKVLKKTTEIVQIRNCFFLNNSFKRTIVFRIANFQISKHFNFLVSEFFVFKTKSHSK